MSARRRVSPPIGKGEVSWVALGGVLLAVAMTWPYAGHLGEYFVLGALLYVALRVDLEPRRALILAVALASGYGMTDEFHQRFVPMRTPDVADWAIDTLGASLGAALAYVSLKHARRALGRDGG